MKKCPSFQKKTIILQYNKLNIMKLTISVFLCVICLPFFAQSPSFDDLTFEEDSIAKTYKPSGKNYAFVKSKRGTSGVNKTSKADSILALSISDIVLVYSELSTSSTPREEANRERWENLLKTYPELFQYSTNYKNLLQYKSSDTAAIKQAQGFYVYYSSGNEAKEAETKPAPEKTNTKSEPIADAKAKKEKKSKSEEKEEPVVKVKKEKRVKASKEPVTKNEDKEIKPLEPEPESTIVKKEGYTKPKKSKDPKACRSPFYGAGDDDLNNFFISNITISKKQRKHSKQLISTVKLQLNFDGSIKKSMVTGLDEALNLQVTNAIKNMDLWNPAVKNGLTVKSEVKMTLLYDKDTKGMKPSDMVITPRPGPKCEQKSDAELFGE